MSHTTTITVTVGEDGKAESWVTSDGQIPGRILRAALTNAIETVLTTAKEVDESVGCEGRFVEEVIDQIDPDQCRAIEGKIKSKLIHNDDQENSS